MEIPSLYLFDINNLHHYYINVLGEVTILLGVPSSKALESAISAENETSMLVLFDINNSYDYNNYIKRTCPFRTSFYYILQETP